MSGNAVRRQDSADGSAGAPVDSAGRSTDWWDLTAAVLLSLATVLTAWSGYQSSRWNGHSSTLNRESAVMRSQSLKLSARADQRLAIDVDLFSDWVLAHLSGEDERADWFRERFRSEFTPVFEDWLSEPVEPGQVLPAGSPFELERFTLQAQVEADRLSAKAEVLQAEADDATRVAEDFVLAAVMFASVLFFAGISSKLSSANGSHLAVTLSGLSLLGGLVVIVVLPLRLGY